MNDCPCGSNLPYSNCCEPLIKGIKQSETAEQLMRSRYSAYAKSELNYLYETTLPSQRHDYDHEGTRSWAEKSVWNGLEIIETKDGKIEDTHGKVEFIANFTHKGTRKIHHESAEFKKEDGKWYFSKGEFVPQKQFIRTDPKIGRNDPCPCGSGKKYKKCCGK